METNEFVDTLIDALLKQIEKECDDLKTFIESGDFPYHKSYYYNRVVKHASAMLLLAGEIKAIHKLQDHTIAENEFTSPIKDLIEGLSNCRIDT
ncbi:MAG: hypothetical protein WCT77_03590 [Bacteroidota bacterium]|jgi:hypothetical protein